LHLIVTENTDVYFNLAAEDYILHHWDADVLMFWRSKKAVVCGKHQNLCGELNYSWCRKHGIDIARRLTGGGTVFHDLGNINFTFIQNIPEGLDKAVNYRRFLDPMRDVLQKIGVETSYSSRNDLLVKDKKISGNAEHVLQRRSRVLHHGTLLFRSELGDLGEALHPVGKYETKAVQSVRSEVTNISDHFLQEENSDAFMQMVIRGFENIKHTNRYVFREEDLQGIDNVKHAKYSKESWILGYSPGYTVQKVWNFHENIYRLEMKIDHGVVLQMQIISQNKNEFERFCNAMVGKEWIENTIREIWRENSEIEIRDEDIWNLF